MDIDDCPPSSPPCQPIVNYFGYSSSDSESESQKDPEPIEVTEQAATDSTTQASEPVVAAVERRDEGPATARSDEPETAVEGVLGL